MNFLLLLSAMLSAVTGVITTGRAVTPQALSRAMADAGTKQMRAPVAPVRPVQSVESLVDSAAMPAVDPLRLAVREPLFAKRRRE